MGVNDLEQVLPGGDAVLANGQPGSPPPVVETGAIEEPASEFVLTGLSGEDVIEPEPPAAKRKEASPEEGAKAEEPAEAPAHADGDDGEPVPYERFSKVYGRMKGLERRLQELESANPPVAQTEVTPPGPQPSQITPSNDPRPESGDFDTYDEYLSALSRWNVREETRALKTQEANEKAYKEFNRRLTSGAARLPGFETRAYIPKGLGDIVIHSEMAAELAYYWGESEETRAEAVALLDLPPREQAYRIFQLEQSLKAAQPPRRQTTKTEFPDMKTVDGVRESTAKSVSQMSPDEYIAHMNQKEGIPYHD